MRGGRIIPKKKTLTERIIHIFKSNPKIPYSPYEIAHLTKAKNNTVRAILSRLRQQNRIQRHIHLQGMKSQRGWYSFHDYQEPRPELIGSQEPKLHGIQFYIKEPQNKDQFIYKPEKILEKIKEKIPYIEITEKNGKYILIDQYGRLRKLTFTLNTGKKSMQIWMGCTQNPLTFNEYTSLLKYLSVVLGEIWEYSDPRVLQLGINEDYRTFKVEHLKTVKVQFFTDQFLQIYQSYEKGLRKEIHVFNNLNAEALKDTFLDIQEKGNSIVNSATNRELAWKVEDLVKKVEGLRSENQELKDHITTLTGALTQLIEIQKGNFLTGEERGYNPPPEDPQSDFTGYG